MRTTRNLICDASFPPTTLKVLARSSIRSGRLSLVILPVEVTRQGHTRAPNSKKALPIKNSPMADPSTLPLIMSNTTASQGDCRQSFRNPLKSNHFSPRISAPVDVYNTLDRADNPLSRSVHIISNASRFNASTSPLLSHWDRLDARAAGSVAVMNCGLRALLLEASCRRLSCRPKVWTPCRRDRRQRLSATAAPIREISGTEVSPALCADRRDGALACRCADCGRSEVPSAVSPWITR